MPGSNWSGTPFDPIYWRATKRSVMQAAQCFGLFVWECVLERSEEGEDWDSGHYEKNGYPIKRPDLLPVRFAERDMRKPGSRSDDGSVSQHHAS